MHKLDHEVYVNYKGHQVGAKDNCEITMDFLSFFKEENLFKHKPPYISQCEKY